MQTTTDLTAASFTFGGLTFNPHGWEKLFPDAFKVHGPGIATWFGGDNDPNDSGETASGILTRGNPHVLGCALPVHRTLSTPRPAFACVPFGWSVLVTIPGTERSILVPLIDNGPADHNPAHAIIDLTPATFAALGVPIRNQRPVQGSLRVDFEVQRSGFHPDWAAYHAHYRG